MTEHNHPLLETDTERDLLIKQLAEVLRVEASNILDPAFGAGIELSLTPDGTTRLTLYPVLPTNNGNEESETFAAVQLTTPTARLEFFRARAELTDGTLRFVASSLAGDVAQLLVRPGGGIIAQLSPPNASNGTQSSETASAGPQRSEIPDEEQTPQNEPLEELSDDPMEELPVTSDEVSEKEPQPRLTILGRIGRTPRFRETRSGTKLASFPVGVPEDDGSTTWHQVTVFNARAEQLAELGVDKGDRVEIIGYLHERQRRRRDGTPYTSEELYAAVIKLR